MHNAAKLRQLAAEHSLLASPSAACWRADWFRSRSEDFAGQVCPAHFCAVLGKDRNCSLHIKPQCCFIQGFENCNNSNGRVHWVDWLSMMMPCCPSSYSLAQIFWLVKFAS